MTAHPAIRHDPHDPCPFCGCGPTTRARRARVTSPPLAATVRHTPGLPPRFRSDPNWRPYERTEPFGELPADWAYAEQGTREHTATERAEITRAEAYIAEHRGEVAIIDEHSNAITGWRAA